MPDAVDHPAHYTAHPSGIECIEVTEHFNFNIGNAIKYLWRSDLKGDAIENLRKAIWYIEREIQKRECTGGVKGKTREECWNPKYILRNGNNEPNPFGNTYTPPEAFFSR